MTDICRSATGRPKMLASPLRPVELRLGQDGDCQLQMDAKRNHMAGGEMTTKRPATDDRAGRRDPSSSEDDDDDDERPTTRTRSRDDRLRHRTAGSDRRRSNAGDFCDIKAENLLCFIGVLNPGSSTVKVFDPRAAKLNALLSPTGSGLGRSRRLPGTPVRRDRDVGTRAPRPSGELQKYENIPVPGIIPRSRVTSSPTSQPPADAGTDSISFYSRVSCLGHDTDKAAIFHAEQRLKESGFYYDNTSVQDAKRMLHPAEVGTFLVRISSQPSHFFALSVKTNRGTTSIRIAYDAGRFRLDADADSVAKLPSFGCVLSLIEHYVVQSASDARNKCVFLESNGRRDTPVILTRPFRSKPQTLRHLCRRTLHYRFSGVALTDYLNRQSASVQVRQYLHRYPYAL